ncbi:MAG: Ig-like domain-containing protein [Candidatus Paceibacterota bacterium]
MIDIIVRIINIFLGLLGIIAVSLTIYAGFLIMTAGGDESRIEQGKAFLRNAVIGLAIILSAFAIVQFIAAAFGTATGLPGGGGGGGVRGAPATGTFASSGALGDIIQDHHPFRDETGVPRNTRIAVTFKELVDTRSFITDTTGDGQFGNCKAVVADWATDCDQLKTAVVRIFPTATPATRVSAAAIAILQDNHTAFTVVFRPVALLGSDGAEIPYTVELTGDMLKADGATSAFAADRDGRYVWDFATSVRIDTDPPTVEQVSPEAGAAVPKNTIIQVTFSEPMDPSVVQGTVNANSAFTQMIFGTAAVSGRWRLTSAYRTAEFVSDQPCGQNTCGDVMYCLPASPATCPTDNPHCKAVLLRTARLLPGGTGFESVALTGIADMSGNALDGDADGARDGKPALPTAPATVRTIGAQENRADNYLWSFTITDAIDRTAPYIASVAPGIDEENVPSDAPVAITFSGRMWEATLADIGIEERGITPPLPLWTRARTTLTADNRTVAAIDHRGFGPNDTAAYYFPSVPSTVKSASQNCLYPGRGPYATTPNTRPTCAYAEDAGGNPVPGTGANCVPVTGTETADTGCVYTGVPSPADTVKATTQSCLDALRQASSVPGT